MAHACDVRRDAPWGSLEEARHRADGLLNMVVDRQASMLAFDRLFLLMGIALICGAGLLVFFRTGKAGRWRDRALGRKGHSVCLTVGIATRQANSGHADTTGERKRDRTGRSFERESAAAPGPLNMMNYLG